MISLHIPAELCHPNYASLLKYSKHNQINGISIRRIDWRDFKGEPNSSSPYFAHIFWKIDYELIRLTEVSFDLKVDIRISPNSWVVQGRQCEELLLHEYGHYLIGCLCALTFKKRWLRIDPTT